MSHRPDSLHVVIPFGIRMLSRSEAKYVKRMGSKIKGCVQRVPASRARQGFPLNIAAPRATELVHTSPRTRHAAEHTPSFGDLTP
jgi:hypothetical protein